MILGLGSDIVDIRRIEGTLARFGERFLARVFTEEERRRCEGRAGGGAGYARRFAAKEACAKALGVGVGCGVGWRDLGVVNEPSGKPAMRLTGGAAARLAELTPPGMTARVDLSMADDRSIAQAVVVISALPRPAARKRVAGPASRRRSRT